MYAVTGAGGKLGRHAVEALLGRGVDPDRIVAVVRTPAKVADLAGRGVVVREADYGEPGGWPTALAGVDTLLLVSGNEFGQRLAQHRTVIDAAHAAGVGRVAYTSILKADTSTSMLAPEHLATERALQDSGLAYTILRNSWYFENYLGQAEQYLAQGALVSAAGSTPFTSAARADYADAAAAALIGDGHENVVYELGGERLTAADVAAAISRASGTEVAYRAVGLDELRAILTDAGVPPNYVELTVDVDRTDAAGEFDTDSQDLPRLLGREPVTFDAAARAQLG